MDKVKEPIFRSVLLLLPFLLVAVVMHWVSVLLFVPFVLATVLLLNRDEAFFTFLIVFTPLFNYIAQTVVTQFPIGSIFSVLVAFAIMNVHILKLFSKRNILPLVYIGVIIGIMAIYYILGPINELSTTKMLNTVVTTIPYTIGMMLFCMSKEIRPDRIALMFVLFGLSLICVMYDLRFYSQLEGVLDFNTIRANTVSLKHSGLPYINYHTLGFSGVWAVAYLLAGRDSIRGVFDILLILVALWIILLSGARQALISFVLVFGSWLMVKNGRVKMSNVVLLLSTIVVGYLILEMLELDIFQKTLDADEDLGGRLNRDVDTPLEIMKLKPLFGLGVGQYHMVSASPYPHNLLLELICEFGIVGLILFTAVVVHYLILNRSRLGSRLKNGFLPFIIILPYFVRSMISDDLSRNIVFFIALFSMFNYNQREQDAQKRLLQPAWGRFISVKRVKPSDARSEESN